MSETESVRPRVITAAQNAWTAAHSVHPDAYSEARQREPLLRATELLEAATLLLTASHCDTVRPRKRRGEELRDRAERITAGRTIPGEPANPSPAAEAVSGGADTHREGSRAGQVETGAEHAADGGALGLPRGTSG